jgi:hypothetical protein
MVQSEVWLELFDNVFADEAVYISENINDSRRSEFIENYVNGRFQIEIRLQEQIIGTPQTICYRLTYRGWGKCGSGSKKFKPTCEIGFKRNKSDPSGEECNRQESMLVMVPEVMKQSQRTFTRTPFVRSLEGLYILDDGSNFIRELKEVIPNSLVGWRPYREVLAEWESRFSFRYWKEYTFRRSMLLANKPQSILNHRTKIVDTVSSSESYLVRNLAAQCNGDAYVGVALRIKLSLGNNLIGVTVEEAEDHLLTVHDVILRPLEPRFNCGVIWRHEKETSNAENPEGPRDSDSYQGRVRKELGQGDEDQADSITQQPEGLESQTSPVHRPGECISRHTHSGSLEDADREII